MSAMTQSDLAQSNALFNNYGPRALQMVRGEGVFLYDDAGKQYLDFTAGIAVCNLGHADKGLAEVIAKQAGTLLHTSNLFLIPGQVALAQKLADLARLAEDAKVMFVNSGTEANEAALKLVRKYHASVVGKARTKVLSLPNAFHGRTMGALSLTPKAAYHEGFTPLVPDCVTPETLADVLTAIDEDVAACIVEVVQGEAGVYPLATDYLQALANRLHEVGALLIVDEVQTGVGRTGSFFAYEQVGVQPDIITLAKGLGNGVPVGAVIARASVAAAFSPGSHGSTFGGNPLAMAASNYVVDTVTAKGFLDGVCQVSIALEQVLRRYFTNVSGRGMMWGFDVADANTFAKQAMEQGLLVTKCSATRIRIVPPLILQEAHVERFERIVQKLA
ncbi:aspartate aminotransferase family protein [Alicyclobacillus suci]|uniref:aspartate aminotransferase family protein n=1 Tax=Alicyclobacillus suci TaxID=2816080 RepID=UPI001F029C25|nr:acetylornithine/succinylornithine family transaminase [Alicyclobacillus suci]